MTSVDTIKLLPKYSMGVGDRFGHEGRAQIAGLRKAHGLGFDFCPVWNKSNREHNIIGTNPVDARAAADAAVKAAGWTGPYFVDADHISQGNVDRFLDCCDFFTIDVAAHIGRPTDSEKTPEDDAKISHWVQANEHFVTEGVRIEGIPRKFEVTKADLVAIARRFLQASQAAGDTYRYIVQHRKTGTFAVEVSMDEVPAPQTPTELYFVVRMLAEQHVPIQTVAPKFTGRFNKGVQYVGDTAKFEVEFEEDVLVLAHCAKELSLPSGLKVSVHSGSDKFALYPIIGRVLKRTGRGVHLKTAGTTWLEECIGIAEGGDAEAVNVVRDICLISLTRIEELCKPYADVIDIDTAKLPSAETLRSWTGKDFAAALRHLESCNQYNPSLRQLVHVGFKVAAEMGDRYKKVLESCRAPIEKCVSENIFDRHLQPLISGMSD